MSSIHTVEFYHEAKVIKIRFQDGNHLVLAWIFCHLLPHNQKRISMSRMANIITAAWTQLIHSSHHQTHLTRNGHAQHLSTVETWKGLGEWLCIALCCLFCPKPISVIPHPDSVHLYNLCVTVGADSSSIKPLIKEWCYSRKAQWHSFTTMYTLPFPVFVCKRKRG